MKKHVFYWLALGLIMVMSCQKELSFEVGNNPSHGSLQADASGDCLPKTVNGVYMATTALVPATNTLTVRVNVTTTGNFIVTTDTVNGYFFRATGTFTALGNIDVTLRGNGTPFAAGVDNFVVSYDSTTCDIAVTVLPAGTGAAVFTLNGAPAACTGAVVNGTYATGIALNASNTVTLNVMVTTVGTYNITTSFQGMTFSGSGALPTAGAGTVVLTGSGIPSTGGPNTVPVTVGTTTCNFLVTVTSPAIGTLGGGPGVCTPVTVAGTYTVGTLLTAANTVQVQMTITSPGAFSISSDSQSGFSFSGSGTAAATGTLPVTLVATGTPTSSGVKTFTLTFGTSTCTFTVNVTGAAGAAVYTINCPGVTVQGTYQVGVALTGANTITIPVSAVTTPGSYTITGSVNGMMFSGSGNISAPGNIILTSTGTPSAGASPTSNLVLTSPACTIPITVAAAGGGGTAFSANCSSATPLPAAVWEVGSQLNSANTVNIGLNVTVAGPYNITTTTTNGMTFSASGVFATTGPITITLQGSGTPITQGLFNIPMPGTIPCTFPITVDAAPPIDWQFTVTNAPTTTYRGQTDNAQLIPAPPPGTGILFVIVGSNSLGSDNFQFALNDINSNITNGETYTTTATAAFQYDLATGADSYKADPSVTGASMTFTVTTHNVATKTVTGTFSGTAKNNAGAIITITAGTFTGTYQ